MMADQVDASNAPFVSGEAAKYKTTWVGTRGATIAQQARSLAWTSIDFWGVHSFITFARYSTPQPPLALCECFKSETSYQQVHVSKVIDRFLTGFGWRKQCFSTATSAQATGKYAVVAAFREVNPEAAGTLLASAAAAPQSI